MLIKLAKLVSSFISTWQLHKDESKRFFTFDQKKIEAVWKVLKLKTFWSKKWNGHIQFLVPTLLYILKQEKI